MNFKTLLALASGALILSADSIGWAAPGSKILSVTVGQVGKSAITSREVQIAGVLDHWFLTNSGVAGSKGAESEKLKHQEHKDWLVPMKSAAFSQQLSMVMLQYLVVAEAENFSVARISPEEVTKNVKAIEEDLKGWPEWKALEVSTAELENAVARQLRSKEFLRFKTESLGFQISDEEAKAYYEQNRAKFSNLPFERFRDSIKDYLSRRDVEGKMKDWFTVLRRKYKVKILQYDD